MKVIYKELVSEEINKAIVKAEQEGRRISKIVLTEEEFEALRAEVSLHISVHRRMVSTQKQLFFCGVLIEVEDEGEF